METPLFRDPDQPIEARVQDLLGRMTLEEKLSQMTFAAAAVPRLGIPAYNFWNEALHGVARSGRATIFPQAIGMAATWDPALVRRVADAIATEGRAKYNAALRRRGDSGWFQGLTYWSPNINIYRDPRWGRGQETWGEDPYLTGEMGAAFVQGLQGDHPRYLKAAACAKHYAVHSGPELLRHGFDARVSAHDLHDTYLPAFRKLVAEANVEAVMGAYNRVNGEPANASQLLLGDILREQWGFRNHVVSDCGAVADIYLHHQVAGDAAEAAALALVAGCDLDCGAAYKALDVALERGLIREGDIDRALARTLATRFKLGMFDPPGRSPYDEIDEEVINSPAHRRLAYEAAVRSVVLLKNRDGLLPLPPDLESLFVCGPNAASLDILFGNYHGLSETMSSILQGVVARTPEGVRLNYRHGCMLAGEDQKLEYSVFEAGSHQVVVACLGLSPLLEGEEGEALLSRQKGDRDAVELSGVQVGFLRALARTGAKLIVVLAGGGPIALGEVADLADAILFCWYPGQEGGVAVADVLFGHAAPGGRLPVSFPRSTADLPPFEDYSMAGRTYRYAQAEPLYPFGFGLGYTTFAYRDLEVRAGAAGEPVTVRCTVENVGAAAGEEVAQVYAARPDAPAYAPRQWLAGFRRLALAPGEAEVVEFTLAPEQTGWIDEEGRTVVQAGRLAVTVGGCAPGDRGAALGAAAAATAETELGGG